MNQSSKRRPGNYFGALSQNHTLIIKGIGILAIVFHNYFHWVLPNVGENEFIFDAERIGQFFTYFDKKPFESINLLFSYLGHFGVQLFIFISGYGLAKSTEKRLPAWSEFVADRLRKLFPVFIAAVIMLLMLNYFRSGMLPATGVLQMAWRKLILVSNFVPGEGLSLNGPWWFYSMIVQLYLLFPLAYRALRKYKWAGFAMLILPAYALVYFVNPLLMPHDINLWMNFPGHLPEFAFGVFLAMYPKTRMPRWVYFAAFLVFAGSNVYEWAWPLGFLSVTVVMLGVFRYVAQAGWGNRLSAAKRFIAYYGALSMYLFAVHGFLREPFVKSANGYSHPVYTVLLGLAFFGFATLVAAGLKVFLDWLFTRRFSVLSNQAQLFWKRLLPPRVFSDWGREWIFWVLMIPALRILEFVWVDNASGLPQGWGLLFYNTLGYDGIFLLKVLLYGFILFRLFYLAGKRLAIIVSRIVLFIYILASASLIAYYRYAVVPLDEVVLAYTFRSMVGIAVSSSESQESVWFVLAGVLAVLFILPAILRKPLYAPLVTGLLLGGLFLEVFTDSASLPACKNYVTDSHYHLAVNKANYFVFRLRNSQKSTLKLDINHDLAKAITTYQKTRPMHSFSSSSDKYPFWHKTVYPDVIGEFLHKKGDTPPNIVFVIVESLGRDISGPGAVRGSFTPFIDSLANSGLYWPNTLSTSERTFGVLPALLGSLPYGRFGFSRMGDLMPTHQSLTSLLAGKGYRSFFFYGGDPVFNNMKTFLQRNQVSLALNNASVAGIDPNLETIPTTWGWDDLETYQRAILFLDSVGVENPRIDIYLTLSSHSPFVYPDRDFWMEKAARMIDSLHLEEERARELRKNLHIPGSFLFADDAVRKLLKLYAQRPDFTNTVFVITGDHRVGELSSLTRIDNYHVPFIIWSPLLMKPARFDAVTSHLDVTPSLLAFLREQYDVYTPDRSHWLGNGIDTSAGFRSLAFVPFMTNNRSVTQLLKGAYFLSGDNLYKVKQNLGLTEISDEAVLMEMKAGLEAFEIISVFSCEYNTLVSGKSLAGDNRILEVKNFKSDFDSDVDRFYQPQVSDMNAFSQPNSLVIRPGIEYGGLLPEFGLPGNIDFLNVKLKMKVFLKEAPGDKMPLLVFSVKGNDGSALFYRALPLTTLSNQPLPLNEWTDFTYFLQYDMAKARAIGGASAKLYIWNNNKSTLWYDDLEIQVTGQ
jgi:uncharacterized sulfatase